MAGSNTLSTPAPSRTGSSRASSVQSETPVKYNMAATNVFIKGNLEEQKEAIRKDLGSVPEVTVDFMLEHIIPKSQVDVSATKESLVKKGLYSEASGWTQFKGKSPRKLRKAPAKGHSNNKETEVFLNLKTVYEQIVSSAVFSDSSTPPPTLSFEQYPNTAPVSATDVKTRPDGVGILTKAQAIHSQNAVQNENRVIPVDEIDKPNWFDIAFVEEYKLGEKPADLNDNIYKILWSLHHIMHTDHRRRFTFGLTIENRNTRIWFCCRQIVIVSQPFDFSKDASKLIHLITSLAYATPTQLGYDPTMALKWRNNAWHYDIYVTTQLPDGTEYTQKYETYRVICDAANNIRGRATRVYEANIVDPEGKRSPLRAVIKDSWIDVGRAKEGDTLSQILEGASPEEKSLFLTVLQHGVVQIDGRDDSTQDLILDGQSFFSNKETKTNEGGNSTRHRFMLTKLPEKNEDGSDDSVHSAHELVYNTPLFPLYHPERSESNDSKSNQEAPSAPSSSQRSSATRASSIPPPAPTDALPHKTPYEAKRPVIYSPKVHYRIAFQEVGVSLLSMAGSGRLRISHVLQAMLDVTLALKFMAKRGYVHRDVSAGNVLMYNGRAKLADLEFAKVYGSGQTSYVRTGTYSFMSEEVACGKYTFQPQHKFFLHSPVHDLESLWWVGVWCLMWHYPVSERRPVDPVKKDHMDLMRDHGMKLFPSHHTPANARRINEIHSLTTYTSRSMEATEYPDEIFAMISRMDLFRQCISWAHKTTQAELPRNDASYFSDVLYINDPAQTTIRRVLNKHALPIFDMVTSKLKTPFHFEDKDGKVVPPHDYLLWPLDAMKKYDIWLVKQKRPKAKEIRRGAINLNGDGYFET
ncbi:hypothetical protein HYPSUDRAFT_198334 [Hypholoma sublateritium FD-334 SS-4]|uniref:Protein kinase domain-containing protein n=1 Tax=Hypholoma sublateritium (strain FD-334 SS-4) TaxID=945553 RepID=A0A0D2LHC8_HYPSF|nr:hypothetical protein HYPSUDRAFT_198334 [Hypholoma sublateritium FD-334 SS-4]